MTLSIGASAKGAANAASSIATASVTTQAKGTFLVSVSDPVTNLRVTDNKGNKFIKAGLIFMGTATLSVFKCENGNGGAGHIVTATALSGSLDASVMFIEVNAAAGFAAVVDKLAKILDAASPYTLTSPALSGTGEFGLTFVASNTVVTNFNESTGYTTAQTETNDSLYWTSSVCYKAGIGAGAESPRSLGGRRCDDRLMEAMQTAWRRLRYRHNPWCWQRSW